VSCGGRGHEPSQSLHRLIRTHAQGALPRKAIGAVPGDKGAPGTCGGRIDRCRESAGALDTFSGARACGVVPSDGAPCTTD
jgi:hypothetical protein